MEEFQEVQEEGFMSNNSSNIWDINWSNQPISINNPGSSSMSYVAGVPILTYSGTVVGSVVTPSESSAEPTLFDEVEAKMLGKSDGPKLENKNIVSIRSILTLIHNTFSSNYHALNCFFSINKICFHSLSNLPVVKLNLAKDGSSTIVFSSDWKGERKTFTGWDLNENETPENIKRNMQFNARSTFIISDATNINIYKWGFEVFSQNGMKLVAILSYALVEKPEQTIGHSNWSYPLRPEILKDEEMLKPIASWNLNQNVSQEKVV